MFNPDDKKTQTEEAKKAEEKKTEEFELNDDDLDQAAGGLMGNLQKADHMW